MGRLHKLRPRGESALVFNHKLFSNYSLPINNGRPHSKARIKKRHRQIQRKPNSYLPLSDASLTNGRRTGTIRRNRMETSKRRRISASPSLSAFINPPGYRNTSTTKNPKNPKNPKTKNKKQKKSK
jgi:hypothetical protein